MNQQINVRPVRQALRLREAAGGLRRTQLYRYLAVQWTIEEAFSASGQGTDFGNVACVNLRIRQGSQGVQILLLDSSQLLLHIVSVQ